MGSVEICTKVRKMIPCRNYCKKIYPVLLARVQLVGPHGVGAHGPFANFDSNSWQINKLHFTFIDGNSKYCQMFDC